MKKVAINGFGRIGRLVLRRILEASDTIEVAVINATVEADLLAYLFKYDSTHGVFKGEVHAEDEAIVINGKAIPVRKERDASNLIWSDYGVDIVLDCTGAYSSVEKAQVHLDNGAKKVLLSSPGKGEMRTVVYGVNHETIEPTDRVISNSSCTTNCLAPMAKVLNDNYGIKTAILKTIHAYTANQQLQDKADKKGDWRRGRAAAVSIVPTTTGAARMIGKVIPELDGKIDGSALRIPVLDGSITQLTCVLEKKTTVEEINAAMKAAANECYGYTEDPIVSADIVSSEAGGIFDATLTSLVEVDGNQLFEVNAWYDNEYGYTCQLVRTLEYIAEITD